jgi:hypothetical protein
MYVQMPFSRYYQNLDLLSKQKLELTHPPEAIDSSPGNVAVTGVDKLILQKPCLHKGPEV